MERIIVEVDPDLEELIPDFLDRKRIDAQALQAALDTGNFTEIARLGHKIKGEGGSFGFDAVSEIGAALEQSAQQSDRDSARKLVLDLSEYLERVEIVAAPQ